MSEASKPSSFETLQVDRCDQIITITLNRPQVRNAMSMQMCRDLIRLFGEIRFDDEVRLILIRGAGTVFCSGIDLSEFKDAPHSWILERRNLGIDAFMAIETCAVPVVAAVHGAVIGAGGEIMLASDFSVARHDTKIRWPEVVWGAVGATQRLPRLVGMVVAKDLLLTGRTVDAEEAVRLGLIARVVESDQFEPTIAALREQFMKGFPLAARLVKKSMMLGRDLPIQIGVDIERQLLERSLLDAEWRQGTAAFEDRKRS